MYTVILLSFASFNDLTIAMAAQEKTKGPDRRTRTRNSAVSLTDLSLPPSSRRMSLYDRYNKRDIRMYIEKMDWPARRKQKRKLSEM